MLPYVQYCQIAQIQFNQIQKQFDKYTITYFTRFLVQLVSSYLKSPSEQIKICCLKAITKLQAYNPLNSLQLLQQIKSLGQCNDERTLNLINSLVPNKLNSKIASIYSELPVWDLIEEIIYICGKILDAKYFEISQISINDKCLQVLNIIQKHQQVKDILKNGIQLQELPKFLKNDPIKTITTIYINSLKAIYQNHYEVWLSHTSEFPIQLSNAINSLIQKQIQISQLYSINDEFQMNQFPMLGYEGQLKKTQTIENIYIVSMFPAIHFMFLRRKRFARQLALLGNDEKKYLFVLKNKKVESKRYIQKILDEHISQHFVKTTHLLNQNYKETKVRNIKHIVTEKYFLEHEKVFQIEPYQEETFSLSNIHDTLLSIQCSKNNNNNNIRVPYYTNPETLIQKQDLHKHIYKFSKTMETFVLLRKTIVTNIGVQQALAFIMASSQSPRQLENIQLNLSNGNYYQKKSIFKASNQKLVLYDPYALRYSPNIEYLVGELNLYGYLIPAFTATIIGLLAPEIPSGFVLVIGMQRFFDAFIKDSVYDNGIIDSKCEQLISISRALFSGQLEKLKPWARRWF